MSLVFCAGCGTLDPDIEDLVTIDAGVYGQLVRGCDTSGCSDSYVPSGVLVGLFDVDPQADRTAPPTLTAVVGERGFYEISVGAGVHWLLVDAVDGPGIDRGTSAAEVTLTDGALERWDWGSGPGGGFWSH